MRIPDIKGLISIANARLETTKRPQPGLAEQRGGAADKVELSNQAQLAGKLLEAARDAARQAQADRQAALEQAKQELSSGGLKVDSQAIARRMLDQGTFDDLIGGAK